MFNYITKYCRNFNDITVLLLQAYKHDTTANIHGTGLYIDTININKYIK